MNKKCITAILGFLIIGCGERPGTVKWNDCREQMFIKENSFEALSKRFTCDYIKTRQGRVMGGLCVHIEYESGQCKAAYIYVKEQAKVCSKENPILKEDDLCYAN
jgi:hypothetical protein